MMRNIEMLQPTMRLFLDYEIRASWWASSVSSPMLQELAGMWFAWKVRRKYKRFTFSLAMLKEASRLIEEREKQ